VFEQLLAMLEEVVQIVVAFVAIETVVEGSEHQLIRIVECEYQPIAVIAAVPAMEWFAAILVFAH
jgi:hypothetical protein